MQYKVDIVVFPTISEPDLIQTNEEKRSKWHFPRRINMLAAPKMPVQKYVYPDPHKPFEPFYVDKIDPETLFRAQQLCTNPLKSFSEIPWHTLDKKLLEKFKKHLKTTWDSIYLYYKKQLRDKQARALKLRQKRLEEKKKKGKKTQDQINKERSERTAKLATPKRIFLPPALVRQWKAIEDIMNTIDALAEPKRRTVEPLRELGIVPAAALKYEITEAVRKLAQPPERWRPQTEGEEMLPGNVHPRAKYAICTPRLEELAKPSLSRREARKNEDEPDPFQISPTALKYKPTPRILELAKPLERD